MYFSPTFKALNFKDFQGACEPCKFYSKKVVSRVIINDKLIKLIKQHRPNWSTQCLLPFD